MFSYVASYIWGTEEEEEAAKTPVVHGDQIEIDNEWIYIPTKEGKKKSNRQTSVERTSNTDTPSQVPEQRSDGELVKVDDAEKMEEVSLDENSKTEEQMNEERQKGEERILEVTKQEPQKNARRQLIQKRIPLKDLNEKISVARKNDSPKNIKRNNLVQFRNHSTRKNKQYGRMEGKHSGMVGKRAK